MRSGRGEVRIAPCKAAAEEAEPDFDQVEPSGVGGSEVERDVGMARQPAVALGLGGGEVVQDRWRV